MKDIYAFIASIKERIWMYIRERDPSSLQTLLDGYQAFASFNNIAYVEDNPPFIYFNDYVAVMLGYTWCATWRSRALNQYYKDPIIALEKFFVYLEDFKRDMKDKDCKQMAEYLKDQGYKINFNFSYDREKNSKIN